jgi:hypothetical protein
MKQALLKAAMMPSKNHVSRERDCQLSSHVVEVGSGVMSVVDSVSMACWSSESRDMRIDIVSRRTERIETLTRATDD